MNESLCWLFCGCLNDLDAYKFLIHKANACPDQMRYSGVFPWLARCMGIKRWLRQQSWSGGDEKQEDEKIGGCSVFFGGVLTNRSKLRGMVWIPEGVVMG